MSVGRPLRGQLGLRDGTVSLRQRLGGLVAALLGHLQGPLGALGGTPGVGLGVARVPLVVARGLLGVGG